MHTFGFSIILSVLLMPYHNSKTDQTIFKA